MEEGACARVESAMETGRGAHDKGVDSQDAVDTVVEPAVVGGVSLEVELAVA